jgi:hypothetical protein
MHGVTCWCDENTGSVALCRQAVQVFSAFFRGIKSFSEARKSKPMLDKHVQFGYDRTNFPVTLAVSFADLTPDLVLDAVDSCGLHCDGRLLALNSYENRVYQLALDDAPAVIAKFYRPQRWSDAAILEEHQFVRELVEQEIPVVPAIVNAAGDSLHQYHGYRFALFPRQSGRAPEIGDAATLEWLGRLSDAYTPLAQRRRIVTDPQLISTPLVSHRGNGCWSMISFRQICCRRMHRYRNRRSMALRAVTSGQGRADAAFAWRLPHGQCLVAGIWRAGRAAFCRF